MTSMSKKERAKQYHERLLKAPNPRAELEKIFADINNLVFAESNKPIDRETKIKILEELEQLVKPTPSLEKFIEFKSYDSVHKRTQASDNSDILDVITAMKGRAK
jgi:hypothetical protein